MTAESSTEAIAHLKQVSSGSQPDIIVTDYRLRKEDTGIKTIEAIRQHCQRAVPALLISGDTDRELLKAIRQQGFYLLHKPIKPAHLHKAMSDLLRFDAMS